MKYLDSVLANLNTSIFLLTANPFFEWENDLRCSQRIGTAVLVRALSASRS